jgi:hypothetical protein
MKPGSGSHISVRSRNSPISRLPDGLTRCAVETGEVGQQRLDVRNVSRVGAV